MDRSWLNCFLPPLPPTSWVLLISLNWGAGQLAWHQLPLHLHGNGGCSFAHICLGYVVSKNLMTACMSQCVLLTWGDNAHTARGDGTDSGYVGSGNPPHITSFSSHSFSHLHVRPLSFHSVCLCLHWSPACVSMIVFQKNRIYEYVFRCYLSLHICL